MSEDRAWVRWYFSVIGLALWVFPRTILHKVFPVYNWAVALYPDDRRSQAKLMLVAVLGLLVVGGLCQVTAWGLKRSRGWARGTGLAACTGLLFGFPGLTLLGVLGFYFVLSSPAPVAQATGQDTSRLRRGESVSGLVVGLSSGVLLLAGMAFLFSYAHRLGLPQTHLGREFWLYLVGGELLVVTIHEFGHAFAAWAVHFRFKVINIGPLTVWKDATGHRHSRFDWKRLLCGGGYTGAVPTSDRNLRLNQILVVFAGPFVSLNAGLLLFLLFLKLPGTVWEQHWLIVGIFAVLFTVDFIGNLIPLGYTDGTLLLHLGLWTRKGQEFSAAWLSTKHVEEAEQRQAEVDFEKEVELRRSVLDQTLAHGQQNSVELAAKYQALGFAELNAKRLQEAEQSLTKSLDILKQCGNVHPLVEANSWKALHQVYQLQQRAADAGRAGSSSIRAFEKCKKLLPVEGRVEVQSALAKLHQDARAYEAALEEIEHALANFPVGRQHMLLKATLFRHRAECEFYLGCPERGLAAVETATQILRSPETSESNRGKAWGEMGTLGVSLWMAGRVEPAVELLSEAVRSIGPEAAKRSARLSVLLATVLRKAGRLTEAEAALPADDGLTQRLRESFLNERARIQLRSGRVDEAIADFEEVLRLNKDAPHPSATGIATVEGSLAEALLEAGRVEQAEAIARTACDVLVPLEHPESAGPLVTLALIAWQRQQESASPYLEEGVRLIREAPLMETASKARFFEAAAERLERFGWTPTAQQLRDAARQHWETLGLTVEPEPEPALETA